MDYFNDVLLLSLFWAFNVSVASLFLEGQKALGFHPKYLKKILKLNEGLTGLERHEDGELSL